MVCSDDSNTIYILHSYPKSYLQNSVFPIHGLFSIIILNWMPFLQHRQTWYIYEELLFRAVLSWRLCCPDIVKYDSSLFSVIRNFSMIHHFTRNESETRTFECNQNYSRWRNKTKYSWWQVEINESFAHLQLELFDSSSLIEILVSDSMNNLSFVINIVFRTLWIDQFVWFLKPQPWSRSKMERSRHWITTIALLYSIPSHANQLAVISYQWNPKSTWFRVLRDMKWMMLFHVHRRIDSFSMGGPSRICTIYPMNSLCQCRLIRVCSCMAILHISWPVSCIDLTIPFSYSLSQKIMMKQFWEDSVISRSEMEEEING
jgi:hypothetical protein